MSGLAGKIEKKKKKKKKKKKNPCTPAHSLTLLDLFLGNSLLFPFFFFFLVTGFTQRHCVFIFNCLFFLMLKIGGEAMSGLAWKKKKKKKKDFYYPTRYCHCNEIQKKKKKKKKSTFFPVDYCFRNGYSGFLSICKTITKEEKKKKKKMKEEEEKETWRLHKGLHDHWIEFIHFLSNYFIFTIFFHFSAGKTTPVLVIPSRGPY